MNQYLKRIRTLLRRFLEFFAHYRRRVIFLILPIGINLTGCFQHYYNTNPISPIDSAKIQELVTNKEKYLILHANGHAYGLIDVRITDGWLDAKLDSIEPWHSHELDPASTTKNHIEKKYEKEVAKEVHIYTQSSSHYVSPIHISLSDLIRMEVYGADKKHTRTSRAVGIIVITLSVAAVLYGVGLYFANNLNL